MKRSSVHSLEPAIFIVDDDPAVRDSLQQLLEFIGFTVEAYGSGESFLEQASLPDRACVLLDLKLPGDELEDWMRQITAAGRDVKVIGTGASEVSGELRRLSIDCVLPKPWRIIELLDALAA